MYTKTVFETADELLDALTIREVAVGTPFVPRNCTLTFDGDAVRIEGDEAETVAVGDCVTPESVIEEALHRVTLRERVLTFGPDRRPLFGAVWGGDE